MSFTSQDTAWHRPVGQLVEALDAPSFRIRLVRLLGQYVPFDSWVALLFSQGRPQMFAEYPGTGGGPDPPPRDYLQGLYLLDPFHIASRENPCGSPFCLADVASECFEQTNYYQRYFRLNVVTDETQINVQLSGERALCLSLGSRRRFTPEQLAMPGLVRPWVTRLVRQRLAFEDEVLDSPATLEPGWQGSLEKVAEQMGAPLAARELEINRLMLSDCSSKEIARKLAISAETVKVHRKHMYGKLGIKLQSELFSLFLQARG